MMTNGHRAIEVYVTDWYQWSRWLLKEDTRTHTLLVNHVCFICILQIGHILGGNFNIHIWACFSNFIATARGTDNLVLM